MDNPNSQPDIDKLKAAFDKIEALRGILPDDQVEASRAPVLAQLQAAGVKFENIRDANVTTGDIATGDIIKENLIIIYNTYQSPPGKPELDREQFARTLTGYLDWVQRENNDIRIFGPGSGKMIESDAPNLLDIYVPITLRRTTPPDDDEIERRARQFEGEMAERQAYLEAMEERRKEGDLTQLADLLTQAERLAVIGGPGSGKSTLLRWLAVSLATSAQTGSPPPFKLQQGQKAPVPLLIPLRYFRIYSQQIEADRAIAINPRQAGTLTDFVLWYLTRQAGMDASGDFFHRLLKGGGCLLMLDGLDEVVSRGARVQMRDEIRKLLNQYPGNQVIGTAREAGYGGDTVFGANFIRFDVQPLGDEQIETLVSNWCNRVYAGKNLEKKTSELLLAIERINATSQRAGQALVDSPLMVTLVLSVQWSKTKLPHERARLYEACVDVILQAEYILPDDARKEVIAWSGDPTTQRDRLARLALAMHRNDAGGAVVSEEQVREYIYGDFRLDEFLEAVRYHGGLFEERGELFQFLHLTFQEYLAAWLLASDRDNILNDDLWEKVTDPWWREVLLMIYAIAWFAGGKNREFAGRYLGWLSNLSGDDATRLSGQELAAAALLEIGPDKLPAEARRKQISKLNDLLFDRTLTAPAITRTTAGNTLARLGDPRFDPDAWYLPRLSQDEPLLGFVEIPAGPFIMGSDPQKDKQAYDDEQPQHSRDLPRYYLARYPVTVAQWRVFVADSGHKPEDSDSLRGVENHPVVWVDWDETLKYCQWLTEKLRNWEHTPEPLASLLREQDWQITLPSEAQWEKAARDMDGRRYPWGNDFDPQKCNVSDTGIGTTSPVGILPSGASPYGLLDMSGNVWEWTRSLWGKNWEKPDFNYPYDPDDGREDMKSNMIRVLRGGSWGSGSRMARVPARINYSYLRRSSGGVRLALASSPVL